jgi:hypothetical protein
MPKKEVTKVLPEKEMLETLLAVVRGLLSMAVAGGMVRKTQDELLARQRLLEDRLATLDV